MRTTSTTKLNLCPSILPCVDNKLKKYMPRYMEFGLWLYLLHHCMPPHKIGMYSGTPGGLPSISRSIFNHTGTFEEIQTHPPFKFNLLKFHFKNLREDWKKGISEHLWSGIPQRRLCESKPKTRTPHTWTLGDFRRAYQSRCHWRHREVEVGLSSRNCSYLWSHPT